MAAPDAIFHGVQAVLFDLDGTLVDTNIDFPAMKRAVLQQAQRAGVASPELPALDILAIVDECSQRLPRGGEAYRRQAWAVLEEIELRHAQDATVKPHAPDVLREMSRRGWRLGLVTRNCRKATDHLLALLPNLFSVTLTREDVPRTKPDPVHLKEAIRRLERPASGSVMIGDHLMDVQAGKAAGTRAIALLFDRASAYFDGCGPDAVFADLQELHSALLNSDC